MWSDLVHAVGGAGAPAQVQDFPFGAPVTAGCRTWWRNDIDAALYLMFQLATTSSVGYSAAHALVRHTAVPHPGAGAAPAAAGARQPGARRLTMNRHDGAAGRTGPAARTPQHGAAQRHPINTARKVELLDACSSRTEWLEVVGQHHATARKPRAAGSIGSWSG